MPPELPQTLPPRRAVDHKIELEPEAKCPTRLPYQMAPLEFAELQKQLDELLKGGLIYSSKAPLEPHFSSKRSKMGAFDCVSIIGP